MDKIVDYQVEMLNVGAADCFIIYYTYENNGISGDRLILIDGGNYSDGEKVIKHINKYYPGRGFVDLAIVTHPDDDHIGGLVYMLEQQRDNKLSHVNIQSFWVNDPANHGYIPDDVKNNVQPETLDKRLRSAYNVNQDPNKNLLGLIDDLQLPRYEAFAGSYGTNIPIKLFGPTEDYYKSLIPDFRGINVDFKESTYSDVNTNYEDDNDLKTETSLSPTLDNTDDDSSAPNRSSLIFVFSPNDDTKYLFTGDACRESFNMIPQGLRDRYRNVAWFKVPHHGSAHNLDTWMIEEFNPEVAYISTEKEGHYLDRCLINALKRKGVKVFSTSKHGSMLNHGFQNRPDYHSVQPY